MNYKIFDCVNNEYLDLTKYCVNGFGDVMTAKGIVLQNQGDFRIEEQFKEINVPLTWEEIDKIVVSLRLTNKAFKGEMRDKLEEKMSNYSMIAKGN